MSRCTDSTDHVCSLNDTSSLNETYMCVCLDLRDGHGIDIIINNIPSPFEPTCLNTHHF
jgi:hypothetical protein